jgi:tape measure domain-containing protein
MARNMTFSVSLKLLTKNFQNGVKTIQSSLARLRQQFSTFVGGIGLGLGFKELIDNAKSLDKAQATLRNVSGGIERYGENLGFVQSLSKRYNQDLITLMGNFSKFYSAASYAGISLEEQQHIYESLTRAAAYFNLTADETNGVMLAVQQMISKGRVSSEELRRQLGERLPGAMNLAAKSMGYAADKMGDFEKAIVAGKITASELLPRLATELNRLTTNLDVNTIQGYSNKLKNTFTELVQSLNVKDMYKDFLAGASEAFSSVSEKLSAASTSMRKWGKRIGKIFFLLAKNITTVLGTIGFSKILQSATASWGNFFKGIENKLQESQSKMKIYKRELETLHNVNGVTYTTNAKGKIGIDPTRNVGVDPKALDDARIAAKAYNNELRNSERIQNQLNNKWGTITKHIGKAFMKMVKFVGMQLMFTAISAALSLIISKTIQWFRKLNEVKRKTKEIIDDLETDINTVTPDESTAKSLILNGNEDYNKRLNLIEQINRALGRTGDLAFTIENTDEEINAALRERINYLRQSNELQAKQKALSDLESLWVQKAGANTTREDIEKQIAANERMATSILAQSANNEYTAWQSTREAKKYTNRNKELKQLLELWDKIQELRQEVKDAMSLQDLFLDGSGNTPEPDPKKKEEEETLEEKYKKIKEEHNNKLRALNGKLRDDLITRDQYDKALVELCRTTLDSIYLLNDVNENTDKFAKSLLDIVKGVKKVDEIQKKINETLYGYYLSTLNLADELDLGLITQEEYTQALLDLKKETLKTLISMGELTDAAQELADNYHYEAAKKANKDVDKLIQDELPTLGSRNTLLDYQKTDSDKYDEMADIYEDYVEKLTELIEKIQEIQNETPTVRNGRVLDDLNLLLERATKNAETFEEAAKFAEVQEDVANLNKELAQGIFDNISGIATAAERLTNSWKSLIDTINDPEASGWEKFLTIFTTFISTIETLVSVFETFQAAMAIAETLSLATAAAEQASIPVKVQDAIATQVQAAATKELAVARHMAQAAAMPYPLNLAAMSTTAAALMAAFAAIPAFAEGGIVKGASSVGDRNLIRVNAGEAVLTKGQQATLWHLLNGQSAGFNGARGNVEFKIRGADLVGTINNYTSRKRG